MVRPTRPVAPTITMFIADEDTVTTTFADAPIHSIDFDVLCS